MSSEFPHITVGQSHPNSAPMWNAIIDAARQNRSRAVNAFPNNVDEFGEPGILIVNNGSDVEQFGVLGLGDVGFTQADNAEEFATRVYMQGETPLVGTHDNKFAIALEPIASGDVGRAVVSGLIQCQVTINETWHECVDITHSDSGKLTSCPVGDARLLWAAGTSGDQWAIVDLMSGPPEQTYALLTSKVAALQEYEATEVTLSPGTLFFAASTGRFFNSTDMGNLHVLGCGGTASTTQHIHPMVNSSTQYLPVFWKRDSTSTTWLPYAPSQYAPGQTFAVKMDVSSGNGGSSGTRATFVYTLKDLSGNQIRTGVNPNVDTISDYIRPLYGEMEAATKGVAYFDEFSQIRLASCNERLIVDSVNVITNVDFTLETTTSTTIAAPE